MGWDDLFPIRNGCAVEPGNGAGDGKCGDLLGVLRDAGERDVREVREATVVEPDDGQVVWYVEAGTPQDIEDAGGAAVIEDGNGGRSGCGVS